MPDPNSYSGIAGTTAAILYPLALFLAFGTIIWFLGFKHFSLQSGEVEIIYKEMVSKPRSWGFVALMAIGGLLIMLLFIINPKQTITFTDKGISLNEHNKVQRFLYGERLSIIPYEKIQSYELKVNILKIYPVGRELLTAIDESNESRFGFLSRLIPYDLEYKVKNPDKIKEIFDTKNVHQLK
ncbi:MAG TPA: hypothetical protein VJJ24_02355 [Candidatus Paceibacterota bacterium]